MSFLAVMLVAVSLLAQHPAEASTTPIANPENSTAEELAESSPELSARADGLLTQGVDLSGADFLGFEAGTREFIDEAGSDPNTEPSEPYADTFGDSLDYSTARPEVLRFRQLMPRTTRSDPHTLQYDSSGAVVSVRSNAAPPFLLFGQVPVPDGMPGASAAILLAVAVTAFAAFRSRAR